MLKTLLVRLLSLIALIAFVVFTMGGISYALRVKTNYSMDQFLPKQHSLLTWDQETK